MPTAVPVLPVPWPLLPTTFVERPNRFLTRIRLDGQLFQPMWDTDPEVGRALNEAHEAGIPIHAIKISVTPDAFTYAGEVPVDLAQPENY